MVLAGNFIDKTASYIPALDPKGSKAGCRLAAFPRRFGKTTWLKFIQTTIGVPKEVESLALYYKRVAGMGKGEHFLSSPLRPVLYIPLYDCQLPGDASRKISNELKGLGLHVEGTAPPRILLEKGVYELQDLFRKAKETAAPMIGSTEVSTLPLILIDEYDAPWRNREMLWPI